MGNFWDEFVDAHKFEGDDPASVMFGRPQPLQPGANESALLKLYQDLIKQSGPLRQSLMNKSSNFLKNGMDFNPNVRKTPQYNFARDQANRQSDAARDSIMETMPGGGVLLDKLADVSIDKARTLTQVGSNIYQDQLQDHRNQYQNEMNRAMQLATGGGFQTGAAGMGQLAQMDVAREQTAAAQQASQKGGAGSAAGGFLGSK